MNEAARVVERFSTELAQAVRLKSFHDINTTLWKLDALQEQPQQLDTRLQGFIDSIVEQLLPTLKAQELDQFHADLYSVLYHLTKIRGAKVIGRSSRNAS